MNIKKIDGSFQEKLSSTQKIENDNPFQQVFDRKLNEVNATSIPSPIDGKAEVIEQSDKILNLLDDYAMKLADPTRSLRDLGPLVDDIEKAVGSIETKAVKNIHNDKALEGFIKDLSVTANVAVYKFHRGDYV